MRFQIGAMSVGDILDRGLKLLLARLPLFYLINLIVLAPLIAQQLFMPELMAQLESGQIDSGPSPVQGVIGAVGLLVVVFLTVVLQPIGTAAILHIISQDFVDRPTTLGDALRFAFSRFLPLLGTSILLGLVIVAGALMCLVPAIIFAVWYSFAPQIVVVENRSGMEALNRSKSLTEGFRWRIFGVIVLLALIGGLLSSAVSYALGLVYPGYDQVPVPKQAPWDTGYVLVPRYPGYYVHILVSQLVNILVQTYQAVCYTLMYFDLRIRKEGYDLEMLARGQAPPPPPLQAEIV
jgi:hypothetical protein